MSNFAAEHSNSVINCEIKESYFNRNGQNMRKSRTDCVPFATVKTCFKRRAS